MERIALLIVGLFLIVWVVRISADGTRFDDEMHKAMKDEAEPRRQSRS